MQTRAWLDASMKIPGVGDFKPTNYLTYISGDLKIPSFLLIFAGIAKKAPHPSFLPIFAEGGVFFSETSWYHEVCMSIWCLWTRLEHRDSCLTPPKRASGCWKSNICLKMHNFAKKYLIFTVFDGNIGKYMYFLENTCIFNKKCAILDKCFTFSTR